MSKLKTLWVIHTTASVADADTEDSFDLVIKGASANPLFAKRFHFPDLPNPDERERARTDEYRFDVDLDNTELGFINGSHISIEILGNDAWLPSTMWVIGEDDSGNRKLIVGIPRWPSNKWWSKDPTEGKASRLLQLPQP